MSLFNLKPGESIPFKGGLTVHRLDVAHEPTKDELYWVKGIFQTIRNQENPALDDVYDAFNDAILLLGDAVVDDEPYIHKRAALLKQIRLMLRGIDGDDFDHGVEVVIKVKRAAVKTLHTFYRVCMI